MITIELVLGIHRVLITIQVYEMNQVSSQR